MSTESQASGQTEAFSAAVPAEHHTTSVAAGAPEKPDAAAGSDSFDVIRQAVEKAFNFRGDITVHTRQGMAVEGYVFDRRDSDATPEKSFLRLMLRESDQRISIRYADITRIELTGKDAAAGKSYQDWLKKRAAAGQSPPQD